MRYVIIVIAFGDGDDAGGRIYSLEFRNLKAANEATAKLNDNKYVHWAFVVDDSDPW